MFVYFTDGTCINDSEIYGVKAKQEQNRYVVEVTIKPINILVIILICRRFSNL